MEFPPQSIQEMNTMPPLLAKWALEYKATNDKSNPELEREEGGHYNPPSVAVSYTHLTLPTRR